MGETEIVLEREVRADELVEGDCVTVSDTRAEIEIAAEEDDDLDTEAVRETLALRDTVIVALAIAETDGEREETVESEAKGVTERDVTDVALVLAERETVGVSDCFAVVDRVAVPDTVVTIETVANAEVETVCDTERLEREVSLASALAETETEIVPVVVVTEVAENTAESEKRGESLGIAEVVTDAKLEDVDTADAVDTTDSVPVIGAVFESVGYDGWAE